MPPIPCSPWTPELIGILLTGILAVITALGKILVDLRSARGVANQTATDAKAAVDETVSARAHGKEAGDARDVKLDQIKSNTDGRLSEALTQIEGLRTQNETLTGLLKDLAVKVEAANGK